MTIARKHLLLICLLLFLSNTLCYAQGKPDRYQILFVLDASGSMYGKWQGKLKMASAKKVLSKLVDSLDKVPNVSMGLRVYGHQFPRDCKDTKLEVKFRSSNADAIKSVLKAINPKGITPIAYSLEQAATDFPRGKNVKNVIILITDGIEECGGNPCEVSRKLQENRVVLKPFVIGLGIDERLTNRFDCLGRFYNASNESAFQNILNVVISHVLDNTTVQVNLLDENKEPTETDVTMSFIDEQTGMPWYHLEHTLNERQQPDAFVIDASPIYSLKVHTVPPIIKRGVRLKPGENNVFEIPAAQGTLHLKMSGSKYYRDLKCRVYQSGKAETINIQDIGQQQRYLVGEYDLEFLTRPRVVMKNVKVEARKTREIVVQNPGELIVNYNGGFTGGIYHLDGDNTSLVWEVSPDKRKEIIYLQPGKYKFVVRPESANKTVYTRTKDFYIRSNGVSQVNIN